MIQMKTVQLSHTTYKTTRTLYFPHAEPSQ